MIRKLPLFLFFCLLSVRAQDVGTVPRTDPPIFALKGATVFVGNGQVIDNATVVIRDGLIEDVGTGITVSPLAWQIDVSGMNIYPGFIDALNTSLFHQPGTRERQAGPAPGRGGPAQAPAAEEERPGVRSYLNSTDHLETDAARQANWRDAGILSANVSPVEGIFRGASALADLNGMAPESMVVSARTGMVMSMNGLGFRRYPGSLMGVWAHIKQTLLDARQYGQAHRIYSAHPLGLKRPETDRAMEALQAVVTGDLPLIMPAESVRQIRRVLKLQSDFEVKTIVAGGFEADQVAAELKQHQVPVLFSLDLPQKPKDANPNAEESLRVLRLRQHAPEVAAALQKAGLQIAFYSGRLKTGKEYLGNLRKVVEHGLAAGDAVQGATLSAARILGVDQQIGSIEKGKIANLFVTDKDVFQEDAKIKYIFVDGIKFQPQPAAERGRPNRRGPRPSALQMERQAPK